MGQYLSANSRHVAAAAAAGGAGQQEVQANPASGPEARRRKRRRSSTDSDDSTPPENISAVDKLNTPTKKRMRSTSRYIYEELFQKGKNADVTIVALGREWHLHRVYLCQAGYFQSMFSGTWKESSGDRIEIKIIDENITEDALVIMFGALYSDIVKVSPSQVTGVLAAATMFHHQGLLDGVSKIMLETLSSETVCTYHDAAQMYGREAVKARCFEWLCLHMLKNVNGQLLRSLSQELLLDLLKSPDLFVLQVEMDLYTVLKQWVYIQLHEECDQELAQVLKASEFFFKTARDADEKKRAFLETPLGEKYQELFNAVRLQHVVGDIYSCNALEADGIIPKSFLADIYRQQWWLALSAEQKNDNGPCVASNEWFQEHAMRFGRVLAEDNEYCWRWVGYCFGFDMVAVYRHGRLTVRRNTSKFPCSRSINLLPEQRELALRVQAFWEETDPESKLTVIKKRDSERINLFLRPDEEAIIFDRVSDRAVYPLYLSFRVAFSAPPGELER